VGPPDSPRPPLKKNRDPDECSLIHFSASIRE
jgi:hypothetical protein